MKAAIIAINAPLGVCPTTISICLDLIYCMVLEIATKSFITEIFLRISTSLYSKPYILEKDSNSGELLHTIYSL